jgi:hypothetical protein
LYTLLEDYYKTFDKDFRTREGFNAALDITLYDLNKSINKFEQAEPSQPQAEPSQPQAEPQAPPEVSSDIAGPSNVEVANELIENIMREVVNDIINGVFKLEGATPAEQELINRVNSDRPTVEDVDAQLEAIKLAMAELLAQLEEQQEERSEVKESTKPEEPVLPVVAGPSKTPEKPVLPVVKGPSEPEPYWMDKGLTAYQIKRLKSFENKLSKIKSFGGTEITRREYEDLIKFVQMYERDYETQLRLKERGRLDTAQRFIDGDLREIRFHQWKYKILQKRQPTRAPQLIKAFTDDDLLKRWESLYK